VAYFLGIDGGGSKTTCVVGDESKVLGSAVAGPSNITRVGVERARESMQRAIREACAAAGIAPKNIKRACIGAAGAARTEIATALRALAAEMLAGEIEVVGDMAIALQAAFGKEPGIIVIAGTGSIAYGRDANGMTARAGGWGYAISDEGSAHWIGRQAVVALLRAADESPEQNQSALFREVAAAWHFSSFDQLVTLANSDKYFAGLLPAVLTAADAKDAFACSVLHQAAVELTRLAMVVVRRLFPNNNGHDVSSVPMVTAGGVFRYAQIVRDNFARLMHESDFKITLDPEVIEPVEGALQLARKSNS
jgi:N-acetylglucosamine kinase-like BadF-type ATPase